MNYYWTECSACSCQLTIQFSEHPAGLTGSVRRWSSDRTINDGRRLDLPREELSPDGSFRTACVCGQTIAVDASAVERAATEGPGP